jgi:hypothetical protein
MKPCTSWGTPSASPMRTLAFFAGWLAQVVIAWRILVR